MTSDSNPEDFGSDRQITVSARVALAAARFMADAEFETRIALTGLWIEPCPAGGITMTASDGITLIHIHDPKGASNGTWLCPLPGPIQREIEYRSEQEGLSLHATVHFDGHRVAARWNGPNVDGPGMRVQSDAPAIDSAPLPWRPMVPSEATAASRNMILNSEKLTMFQHAEAAMNGGARGVELHPAAEDRFLLVRPGTSRRACRNDFDWLGILALIEWTTKNRNPPLPAFFSAADPVPGTAS